MLFSKYPYTDMHEMNLDWILRIIKELDREVDEFVAFNKITFSGVWDGSAYPKWTIVDDGAGNGYLSIQAVPANVPLSNTDYWQPVSQYTDLYNAFNSRIAALENVAPAGRIFESMTEMIASTELKDGDLVYTLGNHVMNDGGKGYWKISATDDADHWSVAFGDLYAIMIDENVFNLARYPGSFVNEMMDAARPYFYAHRWKKIYLPEPNAQHPACGYWTEGGHHRNYFWKVNAPIILDESCAYSTIEFNGGVIAAVDGLEAVLKVTDAGSKPEDIYFIGHTSFGGAELPTETHIPEHVILVEGSARLSFEFLQAGSAQNVITLGGDDQKWAVEVEIDRAEIGSWYKNCINGVLNNGVGIFKCNDLVVQRCLGDNAEIIHGEGAVFGWYIGNLQCSWQNDNPPTGVKAFNIDTGEQHAGPTSNEFILWIDFCRMFGDDIGYFGKNGNMHIGFLCGAFGAATPQLTIDGSAHLMFDAIGLRNESYAIVNNTAYGTCNIRETLPHPAITGRNVLINGVVSGEGTMVTAQNLKNAMVLNPTTGKLQVVYNETYYPVN